jgi:hypothetical protein
MGGVTMRNLRRLLIIGVALGLVMAAAGTATAGKPDKPGKPEPGGYVVTMTTPADGAGLATNCDGGSITMGGDLNRMLRHNNGFVAIDFPIEYFPTNWHRVYEATPGEGCPECDWGLSEKGLTGCHGLSQEAMDWNAGGGALVMMFGRDTVEFEWRFDYYWDFHWVKNRRVQDVLEILWLTSEPLPWTPDEGPDGTLTGTVSGPFTLKLWTKEVRTITETEFTIPLTFEMTITPVG